MRDTLTDEYGNIINPPGAPAGDPGRSGINRPAPAESGCEPQTGVKGQETGQQRPPS